MDPCLPQQRGQPIPARRVIRSTRNDDVIHEPAGHTPAPGPDIDLDPVLLHIGASRQEQPACGDLRRESKAPIREALPFRRFAALDPGLAQQRVARSTQHLVRALGGQPVPCDLLPALPADRRIEGREVEADGMWIGRDRSRPPFAIGQHLRLVVLGDGLLAAFAVIHGRLGLSLAPAQPLELQPLPVTAMGAGHEVAPLVAGLELPLDARQPPHRRRRDHEHLAPMREGGGPCLGQRDRVALFVGRGRIGIDLIQKHIAGGHRAQASGRVRAGQHQNAAGEFLGQHRVASITRAGRAHALFQRRTVFDQRVDPAPRRALGHLDRGQHRQHRARRVMDDKANPVVASLGRADLCGFHEADPLRRVAGRECIHNRAQVGRAGRAIAPGFSCCAGG